MQTILFFFVAAVLSLETAFLFIVSRQVTQIRLHLFTIDSLSRHYMMPRSCGVQLENAGAETLGGIRAALQGNDKLHRKCESPVKDVTYISAWDGTQITCVRLNGKSVTDHLFPTTEVKLSEPFSGALEVFCETR